MAPKKNQASKAKRAKTVGSGRQSQSITTFGIGAIVDLKDHSVMPLGLDDWPTKEECPPIEERDLAKILEVQWLQAPPVASEDDFLVWQPNV